MLIKRNYGLVHVSCSRLNEFLKSKGFSPLTDNELEELGENKVVSISEGKDLWTYTHTDSIRRAISQYENNI